MGGVLAEGDPMFPCDRLRCLLGGMCKFGIGPFAFMPVKFPPLPLVAPFGGGLA